MSNTKQCPCRRCQHYQDTEPCNECRRFSSWFAKAWADINRFAWHVMNFQGSLDHFKYDQPHAEPVMDKNPCLNCICREWCDTPCRKRWKWWDIKMAELRQQLHYTKEEVRPDE